MDSKSEKTCPVEYQVYNTLYQVKSIYNESAQAEEITDKIQRLILKEEQDKRARL